MDLGKSVVDLKVLFDNPDKDDREKGWGLSFLFNDRVLVDTAENGERLMAGVRHFGVQVEDIRDVIITHDHWDHTGGLMTFLREHPFVADVRIWLPPSSSPQLKTTVESSGADVVYPDGPEQVAHGCFVTGELPGEWCKRPMPEQAFVVTGDSEFAMFTACAHPGVAAMLDFAIEMTGGKKPALLAGGFHIDDKTEHEVWQLVEHFRQRGVRQVAPTHCTGLDAIEVFREAYGADCLTLGCFATRQVLLG